MSTPEVSVIASLYGSHLGARTLPAVARAWREQDVPCEMVVGVAAGIYSQVVRDIGEQDGLRLVRVSLSANAPGRLRNVAARSARSPYLYLSDADIVPTGRDFLHRLMTLSAGGRKVIIQPWMYRLFSDPDLTRSRTWQPPSGRTCCVSADDAGKLTAIAGERFVSRERGLIQIPESARRPADASAPVVSHFHWGGALVEHGLFEAAGGYCDEYAGWGKEDDDLFLKLSYLRLTVRAWRVAPALACLHFEHPRPYTALDIEPNRQLLERRRALGAKEMIRLDTAATTRAQRPVRKRPDARQPDDGDPGAGPARPGLWQRTWQQLSEPSPGGAPAGRAFAAPLRAVDELDVGERDGRLTLTATKIVTVEEPYLAAHAAGQEVYPAVFILEAVRQAVALALGERDGLLADLAAIRSLRVTGALHPADQLIVEATVDPRGPDGVIAVEARCRPLDGPPMARLVLEFWPGPAAGGPAADGHAPDTGQSPGTAPPPGIGRLMAMLPAGPTIVLVDRIVGMVPGQSLSAVKAVTFSEPCYQDLASGLPDERYAYPASLMIESFGQAAIVLWHSRPDSVLADKARLPVLAALRDCRLEGRVYPGDTLRHEVEFVRSVEATAFVTGAIWAGTRRVATMGSVIITATMPL